MQVGLTSTGEAVCILPYGAPYYCLPNGPGIVYTQVSSAGADICGVQEGHIIW